MILYPNCSEIVTNLKVTSDQELREAVQDLMDALGKPLYYSIACNYLEVEHLGPSVLIKLLGDRETDETIIPIDTEAYSTMGREIVVFIEPDHLFLGEGKFETNIWDGTFDAYLVRSDRPDDWFTDERLKGYPKLENVRFKKMGEGYIGNAQLDHGRFSGLNFKEDDDGVGNLWLEFDDIELEDVQAVAKIILHLKDRLNFSSGTTDRFDEWFEQMKKEGLE